MARGPGRQLAKLRRLTQPYFLDLRANGYVFTWLLLCMMLIIVGVVFSAAAVGLMIFERQSPEVVEELVRGDGDLLSMVFELWHSRGGIVLLAMPLCAAGGFFVYRQYLRGRRYVPWLLLGGVVTVLLVINMLNVGIGFIARDLTNALVKRDEQKVGTILLVYGSCFIIALPIRSLQFWMTAKLSILWREWITKNLLDSYMGHKAYYDVNPNDEDCTQVDNPDQRIADDARTFTRQSLSFTIGALDALLTLFLNVFVLWSISRQLTIALLVYASVATIVLLLASRKLVKINYNQLRYEADFRFGLVHIRNNAESIAFYDGEGPEKAESQRRLGTLVANFNYLIKWEVVISVLRRSYGYSGYFFPYLLMAPAYLRGELEYGSFVQAKFAFGMVEQALSFVVTNIDEMAAWWAGISRLEGFQSTVEEINRRGHEKQLKQSLSRTMSTLATADDIESACCNDAELMEPKRVEAILLHEVRVETPASGQLLVEDLSLSVSPGQRVLVVGTSGCGKTSLLRVMSGLWQPQAGSVERPAVGDLLFVPQKPYMLLGSLREQLCYPLHEDSFSDEKLRAALGRVRLKHLAERYPDLGVKQDWPRLLSLGEQQRLAFARLLLSAPRFAVLDEATSAVDVATEQALYAQLLETGAAVVSVGHRPSLAAFHDQVLELQGEGSWRLLPASTYTFDVAV